MSARKSVQMCFTNDHRTIEILIFKNWFWWSSMRQWLSDPQLLNGRSQLMDVFSFAGLSVEIPRLCNHQPARRGPQRDAAASPTCTGASAFVPRGRAHVASPAAPAEANAESQRHRAVLVCGRDRSDMCGRWQLPPVRLPPRQLERQRGPAALEEDRGGEGSASADGLHADAVPVGLHLSFCGASEGHPRALWLLLRTPVHKRHQFQL